MRATRLLVLALLLALAACSGATGGTAPTPSSPLATSTSRNSDRSDLQLACDGASLAVDHGKFFESREIIAEVGHLLRSTVPQLVTAGAKLADTFTSAEHVDVMRDD